MAKDNIHAGEWNMDDIANNWDTKLLDDWGWNLPPYKDAGGERQVSFTAKEKEPTFNVTLIAETETGRQILVTRLVNAGFEQGKDFIAD